MGEREVTTVEVKIDTWRELNRRRDPGDSMDDVIRRALSIDDRDPVPDPEPTHPPVAEEGDIYPLPDDLPGRIDPDAARQAIEAAAEFIKKNDGARMSEIVEAVMPDYPFHYDLPNFDSDDRYKGAWWRRVIKPGLELRDDVSKPAPGYSEWTPA